MDIITIGIIAALLGLSGSLFNLIDKLFKNEAKDKKSDNKFYELLDKKFEKDLVIDKEDIVILANSVSREYRTGYSLVILLENYLKFLSENDSEKSISEKYKFIRKIIASEKEEKPFSELPEEEGRLLRNINGSIKHNDMEAINFNIDELKSLISVRHKSYTKAMGINKWSVPLAIIGVLFSIFFGILSLTNSVDYDKINKMIIEHNFNQVMPDSSKTKLNDK